MIVHVIWKYCPLYDAHVLNRVTIHYFFFKFKQKRFYNRETNRAQLYKNRFCGLGLTPVVSDDIRSKRGTFDWLTLNTELGVYKKHLIYIKLWSFQKHRS
jgi:hypothetical protein